MEFNDRRLDPSRFSIVREFSSLPYRNRLGSRVERLSLQHPDFESPSERRTFSSSPDPRDSHDYYHPTILRTQGARGRLKTPKRLNNPYAAASRHTVGFLDYENSDEHDAAYLHYINRYPTRQQDNTGVGWSASRILIPHLHEMLPESREFDFGKVMNRKVWAQKEQLEALGRRTRGHRDF